ncbi:DNA transfer protein p32 [Rhizobium rhizogenes]|uniref:DNA transfer protein p32 n=1 Tax=Rhizobium rhizogenes TaxID=359 RepID=A0AA88JUY2_RHIRH|nr:DNA transfer protein p32 [Rhizobium rhizogenes]KAA3504595.1 DNA transfer protein p32 [Rhizobium rhizogenes]
MPAAAIAVAGVASAGASVVGASKQAKAASKAADSQMAMYQQTREDLLPYNEAGQLALNQLTGRLDELTSPIPLQLMDQAALEKTPGYQFNLAQGMKGVQNSAAARGLGSSGAALKGAATFATGLADSTYQNQFNNSLSKWNTDVANQNNAYNRLVGLTSLGQSAAAQTGAYATQTGQNVGNSLIQGGNAQAAGINGAANALSNGVNSYLGYNYLTKGGMYG